MELPNGIPSHDTFWRIFRWLAPEQFQRCFLRWMGAIAQKSPKAKWWRKTAEVIVEKEADYLLTRKANHPLLHDDVAQLFDTLAEDVNKQAHYTFAHDYAKTVDMGHDRIEVRQSWTIDDPTLIANLRTAQQWPHLAKRARVQAERLAKVRAHWSIENSLHWVLASQQNGVDTSPDPC